MSCLSDGRHYVIVSGGRNRLVEGEYDGEIEEMETTDFDADIVFSDGVFTIYPNFSND